MSTVPLVDYPLRYCKPYAWSAPGRPRVTNRRMNMTNDELTVMSLIDLPRSSARSSGSSERALAVALAGV